MTEQKGLIKKPVGNVSHDEPNPADAEGLFRQVMEAVNDGLWDIELKSGNAYFSPGYYTMLGYEPGEFPACREAWVSLVHPDDRAGLKGLVYENLTNGTLSSAEFRLRAKNGYYRWILGRGKVVARDRDGNPVRKIGTTTDITDQKGGWPARSNSGNSDNVLSVCSCCKSIRDLEGAWQSLEDYLAARNRTACTHGICPGCMESLYGDQDWYEDIRHKYEARHSG